MTKVEKVDVMKTIATRKHFILLVYGSTGSGKTTFVKALLPHLQFPGGLYLIAPYYDEDFSELIDIPGYTLTNVFDEGSINEFRENRAYDEETGEQLRRLFIIDDAMRFAFSERQAIRSYMDAFISDARHEKIDMIMCLQMMKGAPPSIRAQATDIVATRVDRVFLNIVEMFLPTRLSILTSSEKMLTLRVDQWVYLYINKDSKCSHFKLKMVY